MSRPRLTYVGWLVLLTFGFLAMLLIGEGRRARTESACLQHGWPEGRVPWAGFGERFCVRRVDQTDHVVPLDEVAP